VNQTEREIIRETTKLIRERPERFTRDRFQVREKDRGWGNGIEVWVANGSWALKVSHDGVTVADGGVAIVSLARWRYDLWDACMAIPESSETTAALRYLQSANEPA